MSPSITLLSLDDPSGLPVSETSRFYQYDSGLLFPLLFLPSMNIPGKHTEQISFAVSQLTPRQQLKKPINELIRDINKRSKAKLEWRQGPGGRIVFEATGPVDAVRQSLKDIANEVGLKVSDPVLDRRNLD